MASQASRDVVVQVININGKCIYPKTPAFALGLTAAFTVLLVQVISNVTGGCICCKRGPDAIHLSNSSRSLGTLCLVMSWITFLNAFILLLAGASLQHRQQFSDIWFEEECYILKPGVFAGGAILALATSILGVIYHLITCDAKKAMFIAPRPIIGRAYEFQNCPPVPPTYQHHLPPYPLYPKVPEPIRYPSAVHSSH